MQTTNAVLTRVGGVAPNGSEIWLGGPPPPTNRLMLAPLMGGAPRNFLPEKTNSLAWSPDGKRIAYFLADRGDPVFVADADNGNARQIFVDSEGLHNHFPTWSHDGRWIFLPTDR